MGAKPDQVAPPAIPVALLPRTAGEAVRLAELANPKIGKADFTALAAGHAATGALSELSPIVDLVVAGNRNDGYSATIDRLDEYAVKVQGNGTPGRAWERSPGSDRRARSHASAATKPPIHGAAWPRPRAPRSGAIRPASPARIRWPVRSDMSGPP